MKPTLTLLSLLLLLLNNPNFAQNQQPAIVEGDILIRVYEENNLPKIIQDLQKVKGQNTRLHIKRQLSTHLKIWQLQFDYTSLSHEEMLDAVRIHRLVQDAQLNRILEKRVTVPNDPNFGNQWQYVNTGGGGGVVDADIDADLAWDITTGGITALGDTIVVCVIDDGLDLSHTDIAPNRWYNHHEIPNNGIDDDGNGFVDDYNGWDADLGNDNITGGTFGGGHGTPVAGIIGAKGNNGIGVTGVNWDVKLMIVVGGGNEAQAIAAYEYPLTMRKLYNQTNGQQGAFVVSTNASWGINGAPASSAPVWCAMYDTLGVYGVLSAAATANANTNVDVSGDLPTSCPSDYLISVTNMNRSDQKITNAGYGLVTIDVGAPGENAYTVAKPNTYGAFGGTSGASPHVAGAIALLYAAPCPRLAMLAKADPQAAAAMVRDFILQGIDTIPTLVGITTTAGRLNIHNSLQLAMQSGCDLSGCYEPFGMQASNVTGNGATLTWVGVPDATMGYLYRYRENGDTAWTQGTTMDTFLNISGLTACTVYQFQVASDCDTVIGNYANIFSFQTSNCCLAPNAINTDSLASTTAIFSWNADVNVISYEIEYRLVGAGTWTNTATSSNTITLTGLDSCADYELRIISTCAVNVNNLYSPTINFRTKGCGNCEDLIYCASGGGNVDYEWVSNVTLGTINHNSGADGGYAAYVTQSTQLFRYHSYPLSLTLDTGSSPNASWRWKVWIDFDQNGVFDAANELVYDSNPINTQTYTVNDTILIPGTASVGNTRMRVSMKWGSSQADPCTLYSYGETEDYCVTIADDPTGLIQKEPSSTNFFVYPNPVLDDVHIQIVTTENNDTGVLRLIDVTGRCLLEKTVNLELGNNYTNLSTTELPKGIYLITLQTNNASNYFVKKIVK